MIGFSSGRFQESWSQSTEGQSRGTDKRFFVARKSIDLSVFVIFFFLKKKLYTCFILIKQKIKEKPKGKLTKCSTHRRKPVLSS